jgi:hypothetical protein
MLQKFWVIVVYIPCKLCSGRFNILSHAKWMCGQIGLPKVERSLRTHGTVSAALNPLHGLRVNLVYSFPPYLFQIYLKNHSPIYFMGSQNILLLSGLPTIFCMKFLFLICGLHAQPILCSLSLSSLQYVLKCINFLRLEILSAVKLSIGCEAM